MIIRNKVIVSAKYFLNPISPEGEDYFPSIEGFISCRQATFSKQSSICRYDYPQLPQKVQFVPE